MHRPHPHPHPHLRTRHPLDPRVPDRSAHHARRGRLAPPPTPPPRNLLGQAGGVHQERRRASPHEPRFRFGRGATIARLRTYWLVISPNADSSVAACLAVDIARRSRAVSPNARGSSCSARAPPRVLLRAGARFRHPRDASSRVSPSWRRASRGTKGREDVRKRRRPEDFASAHGCPSGVEARRGGVCVRRRLWASRRNHRRGKQTTERKSERFFQRNFFRKWARSQSLVSQTGSARDSAIFPPSKNVGRSTRSTRPGLPSARRGAGGGRVVPAES